MADDSKSSEDVKTPEEAPKQQKNIEKMYPFKRLNRGYYPADPKLTAKWEVPVVKKFAKDACMDQY